MGVAEGIKKIIQSGLDGRFVRRLDGHAKVSLDVVKDGPFTLVQASEESRILARRVVRANQAYDRQDELNKEIKQRGRSRVFSVSVDPINGWPDIPNDPDTEF